MTVNVGRVGSLGMGIEASPSATTAIDFFIPFMECSLGESHEVIADNSAKGVRDAGGASVAGKQKGEGTVSVVLNAKHSPILFALALGAISSATTGALYLHTITRNATAEPLTATVWRDRSVDKITMGSAVVNKLELNFSDDVATLKAEMLSKYPVAGSVETPSIETLELYTFKSAYVELSTVAGATSALKVRELNLSINNNIEAIYAPNSNDVDRFVSKNFEVGGSFTVLFESETQKTNWTSGVKQGLKLVFTGITTGIITITIPSFRVQSAPIDTPIDDVNQQTVEFVAEYNGTESIDVAIVNDVASYA